MTTYVLGAGASRHAGYPLANELGDALVNWLAETPSPVKELYGTNLRELHRLYGSLRNLEEILTELEECPPESLASRLDDVGRRYAVRNMRIMIPEFFRFLRVNPSPLYQLLAQEHIRPGDVVITFNYDVACERELRRAGLWEVGDGYGFPLGIDTIPKSQVPVLKLHGSANWLEVAFNGMTGFFQAGPTAFGSRPIIFPGELEFLGYAPEFRDSLMPHGAPGAYPAIIMPTLKKCFYETTSAGRELESFWHELWALAGRALRASDRIVILGYSMPAADEQARELLLSTANHGACVEIFCGRDTEPISSEFAARGFGRIGTSGEGCFEDYLDGCARAALVAAAR